MKILFFFVLTSVLSVINMAFAQDINIPGSYHWKNRIVLVFDQKEEQSMKQQIAQFQEESAGMQDRDLLVFRIKEDKVIGPKSQYGGEAAKKLRAQYEVDRDNFTVILIGKDGSEKMRQHEVLGTDKLFATIDAMPMRRREMRQDDGN